jgi:ribosomal protein S18 acetylase RimI-like enzyme
MKTRPLTSSDIDGAAAVCAAAWLDSPINEYLYPNRHRHPKAYHELYAREMKNEVKPNPKLFILVAETEPSDEIWCGKREIIGYIFSIKVNKEEEKGWSLVKSKISHPLCFGKSSAKLETTEIREKVRDWEIGDKLNLSLNPAASLHRSLSYGNRDAEYFEKDSGEPDRSLHIGYLAVDPKYQKKGVGLMLTQMVLQRAETERLPVILYSTKAGKALYLKAGFKEIGKWQSGEGEDMMFTVMRWNPLVKEELAHE